MTVRNIESYKIESEDEADAYLKDLFSDPQRRSMAEAAARADKYITSEHIRNYFLSQAKKSLSTSDSEG
ncbi:hypothetical protein [Trinickia diaoshuihuensis]|uniref:hypothetical protein n=1 Tax=Trinickia diaoshuihuensis TaxID=2292265 RepID=UPI000E21CF5F|nr:hypothetical protein [Trinickia diaoshuihuensis]